MDDELEPLRYGYLVVVEECSRQRIEVSSAFPAAVDPRAVAPAETVLHEVLRHAVGTGIDLDGIDETQLPGRRLRVLGIVPGGKGGRAETFQVVPERSEPRRLSCSFFIFLAILPCWGAPVQNRQIQVTDVHQQGLDDAGISFRSHHY